MASSIKSEKKITLGIADDNENLQATLSRLLQFEQDLIVKLSARNGVELLEKMKVNQPNIILMDIRMPEMDGIEATQLLFKEYPEIKIIALSNHSEPHNVINMYKQGVNSFISKQSDLSELIKSIRVVNSGGNYTTAYAAEVIRQHLNISTPTLPTLSINEKRLIKFLVDGLSSSQIGTQIFKSPRTVEDMREKLYVKFQVKNKEQLIALVSKAGLFEE